MNRLSVVSIYGAAVFLALTPASAHAADAPSKLYTIQSVKSYADIADLALNARTVIEATIRKTVRLSEKDSPGIPARHARFLATAIVKRLIAGSSAIPADVSYLVDVPLDSRDKPLKLRNQRVFLFLNPSANRPDWFTLSSAGGQIQWSAEADEMIRSILSEAIIPAARLKITGVGSVFHVPGSIAGESETQIFLTTADQRPVSLSVLRRPGETPQWAVSLGDMVDESSTPAGKNTLLWYQLACFLPAQLPESVMSGSDLNARDAIVADYSFILAQLGPCGRTLSAH